jgi:hypothetical protein
MLCFSIRRRDYRSRDRQHAQAQAKRFHHQNDGVAPSQEEDSRQFKAFLNRIYRRKNEAGKVVPDLELQACAEIFRLLPYRQHERANLRLRTWNRRQRRIRINQHRREHVRKKTGRGFVGLRIADGVTRGDGVSVNTAVRARVQRLTGKPVTMRHPLRHGRCGLEAIGRGKEAQAGGMRDKSAVP